MAIDRSTYKILTFNEAMSETLRCVWIVSNWSKHHSNSSIVSPANRRYASSPGTIGFCRGVAAALFDLLGFIDKNKWKIKLCQRIKLENYVILCTYLTDDTLVRLKKLLRTWRRLANIWANGVTIKSSPPWLKFYV